MGGLDCLSGCSSFILSELFCRLSMETEESNIVLTAFDVYFFPEINPDCLLMGNSKLSLSGCDLSLVEQCSKTIHPELYFFYKALEEIQRKSPIGLLFDLKDCWTSRSHSVVCKDILDKPKQVRELPALMSEFCSFFDYKECEFLPDTCFPAFMTGCLRNSKASFAYTFKIATDSSGHGHLFKSEDYKRLAASFLHSISILCIGRFKKVF
jgi:hypothetical protein